MHVSDDLLIFTWIPCAKQFKIKCIYREIAFRPWKNPTLKNPHFCLWCCWPLKMIKMLSWKSLSEAIVLSRNVSLKYSKLYNAKFANSDKLKIWPKFQSLVTVEPKFDTEFHFCLSRFWLKYKSAIKNLNVFLLETFVQIGALRRYWFETKLSWCSKTSNELLVSF